MSKLSPWKSVAQVSQRDAPEAERCSIFSLSDPCRNISARSPGPPMMMMREFLVFSSCNQSDTKLLRRRRCHSRGCAMERCMSPFPSLCIPGTRYLKRGLVPYVSPPLLQSTKVCLSCALSDGRFLYSHNYCLTSLEHQNLQVSPQCTPSIATACMQLYSSQSVLEHL
ncbi:hypothetical protein O6H91_Y159200 [Diphasiastrum complanatum]|nr:hypothetical protein O6H91_Y159200 [Diphasiastrum complanatum]